MTPRVKMAEGYIEIGTELSDAFNNALDAAQSALDSIERAAANVGKSLSVASAAVQGPMLVALKLVSDLMDRDQNILNEEDIRKAEQLREGLHRANIAGHLLAASVASAVTPAFDDFVGVVTKYLDMLAQWIDRNPQIVDGLFRIAGVVGIVGAGLLAASKVASLFAILLSPAGAIGAAVVGLMTLLDAVGLVDTGLADMANKWLDVLLEFRIGGFSVQTWLLAAWDQVQIGWARVKNFIVDTLDRLWQNFKAVATYVGGVFAAPFQAMSDAFLWVLEQFAKGLDWLSDKFSGWYDQMAMGMIELARLTGFMDEEMARQSSALIRSGQVTAANNDFTGAVQEWRQSNREFWADLETQSDQGLLSLLREAGETADENARRRDEDMQAVIEAIESGMQRRFEADFETPETPSRRRRVDDAFLLGEMGTAGSVGTFGGMAAAQILGTDIDRRLLKTNQEQLGALRQIERNTGAKISF